MIVIRSLLLFLFFWYQALFKFESFESLPNPHVIFFKQLVDTEYHGFAQFWDKKSRPLCVSNITRANWGFLLKTTLPVKIDAANTWHSKDRFLDFFEIGLHWALALTSPLILLAQSISTITNLTSWASLKRKGGVTTILSANHCK